MGRCGRRIRVLAIVVLAAAGCASKQRIALDCVPREVTVYVDGRELGETPESIALRTDESHTVFFKGEKYRPQMVVLRSEEVEGEYRLSPPDLCGEAVFVEVRPEVRIEVESQDSPGPP
jgi:hypothetical protein